MRDSIGDDGMQVYEDVKHILSGGNEAVKNAASVSAAILATRAKAWSKEQKKAGRKTDATGYMKELYITANDIFYPDSNPLFHQALRDGIQLDEKIPVLDIDAMKTVSYQELPALIQSMMNHEPILTHDFLAFVGLPSKSDRYGQKHIIHNTSTNTNPKNLKLTRRVIKNFQDVIPCTSVIEIEENRKIRSLNGLSGNALKVQARKNRVRKYYRLMFPAKHNGNLETIVINAEDFGGKVQLSAHPVSIYEIFYIKKNILSPGVPTSPKGVCIKTQGKDIPSTITIRDMLAGVKGSDGKNYARNAAAGSVYTGDA